MKLANKEKDDKTKGTFLQKEDNSDKIFVALAGNPNVGKSTLFNYLTGLKQHTGNWPGKTVGLAYGNCEYKGNQILISDIPGTYSLLPHSAEEEVAGEYLCFGNYDVVVAVCDATCLERNLNLVLQIMEVAKNVVVCLNMKDEAAKRGIYVDEKKLSKILGVPVVGTSAGKGLGVNELLKTVCETAKKRNNAYHKIDYGAVLQNAATTIKGYFKEDVFSKVNTDWLALRILADKNYISSTAEKYLGQFVVDKNNFQKKLFEEQKKCNNPEDQITEILVTRAEEIANLTVSFKGNKYYKRDRRLDAIFTGKYTGFPIMFLMLALIFWITIVGANYPSGWLSDFFVFLGKYIEDFMYLIGLPSLLINLFMDGIYLVVTWVISVMLPPMAVFFPLFTILEDFGYLPRVAFNLDKYFKCCSACGKQALTMCIVYIKLHYICQLMFTC